MYYAEGEIHKGGAKGINKRWERVAVNLVRLNSDACVIGWLEFNVPCQHKYDYIRKDLMHGEVRNFLLENKMFNVGKRTLFLYDFLGNHY